MLVKTNGIVLRTIRFSESSSICNIFTEEFGVLGFHIPGVAKNKGAIRPSHIMPLNHLELVIYFQNGKNLHKIKELKCTPPLLQIHQNPHKSAIGIFMVELLLKIIKEEYPNVDLFKYVVNQVIKLEQNNGYIADFALYFTSGIAKHLGLLPRTTDYQPGFCFYYESGFFDKPDKNEYCFDAEISEVLYNLFLDNTTVYKIESPLRSKILEALLQYYQCHLGKFRTFNSLTVLHEVLRA